MVNANECKSVGHYAIRNSSLGERGVVVVVYLFYIDLFTYASLQYIFELYKEN